jgi:hypothetical protein
MIIGLGYWLLKCNLSMQISPLGGWPGSAISIDLHFGEWLYSSANINLNHNLVNIASKQARLQTTSRLHYHAKIFFLLNIFLGDYFFFFRTIFSTLHLPPLRFHCADGCWDRTQDRCNWCIGSQTL